MDAPGKTGVPAHAAVSLVLLCLLLSGCGTVEPAPARRRPERPVAKPRQASPRTVGPGEWQAAAESWMGTPYLYGGMDRRGIDCSGLTWLLYRNVAGVTLPRTAAAQFTVGVSVPRSALRTGDLVFFSEPGRGVFHVGLSLGGEHFAHSSVKRGVTISSLREPYYAARWCGAKRVLR